ncbi:MAG: hypothetical protein ABI376_05690 [Caulobacteraceae bacterium]
MADHAEEPEAEQDGESSTPVSPAAVSTALARARTGNVVVDAKAGAFLDSQTRMLGVQMEHLAEQRRLNVKHLEWRLFGDRIKGALQVLSLVAGAAVAIGIAALVWQAHENRGLVVQAFSVPPDMAREGLTGEVAATRVMDKIDEMDAKAQSVRAAATYRRGWGGDIKVEIPSTGVSLGELQRWLRSTLGKETTISGDIFRSPAGLNLTVRPSGRPAVVASGTQGDLDVMIAKAAEEIYSATQPYRYSKYLESEGRIDEALVVARRLVIDGPEDRERAWAAAQVSNLLELRGDMAGGIVAAREALALNRRLALGAVNLAEGEQMLGHDGPALRDYTLAVGLLRRHDGQITKVAREAMPLENAAAAADFAGDFPGAAATYRRLAPLPDFQGSRERLPGEMAFELAQAHDAPGSRAIRASAPDPDIDVAYARWFGAANLAVIPQYFEAVEVGDWNAALAHLDRAIAATAPFGRPGEVDRIRFLEPRRAFVLARLGRVAQARSAIAATPLDCYLCVRMRGKISALAGDWGRASRWFAEAILQAPSLPLAYADDGEMLMADGDLGGAIARFAQSHAAGPRYADALELWGEALLRQGKPAAAAEKFVEAAKLEPRWGRLRLMSGLALAGQGLGSESAGEFRAAAALDLTPSSRAVVDRRLEARR